MHLRTGGTGVGISTGTTTTTTTTTMAGIRLSAFTAMATLIMAIT